MYAAAAIAILVVMVLALTRALLGPTLYDRILAVSMFGTKTVLLIAVLGFFGGQALFPRHCTHLRVDQLHQRHRRITFF